jgi:hypothetical protein
MIRSENTKSLVENNTGGNWGEKGQ